MRGPNWRLRRLSIILLELGPAMNMCAPTPYSKINAGSDDACTKGGRKPCFSVGLEKLDVAKMIRIWNHWASFTAEHEGAKESVVLVETMATRRFVKCLLRKRHIHTGAAATSLSQA